MNAIEVLQWRYAVKKFNSKKKISDKQIKNILKATNLSPSSYGVQTYKMIIIENLQLRREKLQPLSINPQISEASHLILFTIETDLKKSRIEDLVNLIEYKRKLTSGSLSIYKESIINFINSLNQEKREIWQTEQVYIALGTLLYYCALKKIDTCPIGGFSKKGFDKVLGLKEKKLKSIILVAIGYRSSKDQYQYVKKVRTPLSEMILKY